MIFIGIDPGLDGACCKLEVGSLGGGHRIQFFDMPTLVVSEKPKRREYDMASIVAKFQVWHGTESPLFVALERQQSMPDQGVASTFRTGVGYGMLQGILSTLRMPYELVAPVSWKKALMADMPKDKSASIVAAKRLFPDAAEHLTRVKDHGRADALLIAEFCRRRHLATVR